MARLVDGSASAKNVIAPLLADHKSYAAKQLLDAASAAGPLRIAFKSLGLSFYPTLRAIWWRADFEQAANSSWKEAAAMVDRDEEELLSALGSASSVNDLIVDAVTNCVGAFLTNEHSNEASAETIRSELVAAMDVFEETLLRSPSCKTGSFPNVVQHS